MAGQGSARVTLKEIDLSQVRDPQILPQGVPAAVVGTARKGPAFVPRTFANIQQFEEVFGSMSTRGREANSNRIGPLALNEWLKSANAGTYLRVLGVGNGQAADSSGKVESAGFVVGEELVQKSSGAGLSKVGKNRHATVADDARAAASALGKTHFLGCFMKDASGSNYLQESGLQASLTSSELSIDFDAAPTDGDTITLEGLSGDGVLKTFVFTFDADGGAHTYNEEVEGVIPVSVGLNDVATAVNAGNKFKQVLEGLDINGDSADLDAINDPATYFAVSQDNADASILIIRQQGEGPGTNTEVTYNITTAFEITAGNVTKQNSEATQTVASTTSGATATSTVITVSNKPRVIQQAKAVITVDANVAPEEGQLFTILDQSSNDQIFEITLASENITQDGGENSTISIGINNGEGDALTGQPLATRIHSAINDAIDNNNGLVSALADISVTDNDNLTITLESTDNINASLFSNANVTGVTFEQTQEGDDAADSFKVTDILGNESTFTFTEADDEIVRDGATSNYTIGIQTQAQKSFDAGVDNLAIADAIYNAIQLALVEGTLTNLDLQDPEEAVDNFSITSGLAGELSNIVDLTRNEGSALDDAQTDGSDGTPSSITLTFSGLPALGDEFTLSLVDISDASTSNETFKFVAATDNGEANGVVDNGKYQIERPENLAVVLTNIRSAIIDNFAVDYEITINFDSNSITITNEHLEGFAQDQDFVFKLNENVTVTGAETDTGKFGPQTISFVGGGGSAAPVIRGVLMTPQGVRPALSVPSALGDDYANSSSDDQIRDTAVGRSFGAAEDEDLAGYVIGEVSENSQGFTLLLNGFSNDEASAKISCSFDPDSSSYFAKVLNTDPTKIEELGHYLYAWWDIDSNVAEPSNSGLLHQGAAVSGGNYSNMVGFLLDGAGGEGKPDYQSFESRYQTAKTPWIVSQKFGSDSYKLFRLHSLDDGEIGGTQYRLLISDLRYVNDATYGSFTLSLERLGTNPVEGDVIASWKKLSLDPDSRNYIARVIGDQYLYYDFDRDDEKQRLQSKGNFDLRNNYVRIELSDDLLSGNVPVDALPTGFLGHAKLQTAISGNFVEPGGEEGAKVFTASDDSALTILSEAQVAPLKFVRSLSRTVIGSSLEASDDLAWGVKFAKKENSDTALKELSEIEYDPSIASYAKFFPSFGDKATQTMIEDDGASSDFVYDRFSLENIKINNFDSDNNRITDWAGAEYQRGGVSSGTAVQISRDAKSTNVKYLKFRCMFQGGFDGVNIFDAEKADLSGVASLREANDEKESKVYTGPTVVAYQKACDVLADKSAVELQVLTLPGQRASAVTNYAMTACEERFDALYVMDIEEKDASGELIESDDYKPHVANTIAHFSDRLLDSSFGAAYFPDLAVRRTSDNSAKIVPPSVGVLGVISRNDRVKAPWFAPAGLNRGRVNSPGVKLQMNRDLLNDLYDADVNPIYEPAGRAGEVYVFGQKTLLQAESALDRINVRRLLIDIRRKVKAIGDTLLFEPNRESTLAKFTALVEPIMQDVQKRQGVARYKVQIDSSTTTQNDIENNTVRGKIYLQPLKSIEFISLDFVVTNTIE